MTDRYSLSHLATLESESIHILREVAAEFRNPVMLYSVGKDSSVLVRLAMKAFHPGAMPFPLMHVDTGYKFPEMYAFRDRFCREIGARLIVERNEAWIAKGCHPLTTGVEACCSHLKTGALLDAIRKHGFDAAIGGARREEEKSRAKERVFSVRDAHGQWDPKNQRPELWDLYNARIREGETVRAFPLSNWTELDIWQYIQAEQIPIVPLYFARERPVVRRNGILIPQAGALPAPGEEVETCLCRFRSLGCMPCTGAVESSATSLDQIIAEVAGARKSERENRIIDLTSDSSMEQKKKEGYF
ncbi:MAG: sulfate adenylyltransferase subunit CysD [Holophaga sp.]|nr:sulfate adenylyltransferase subunit CysD [Holophaga sp.]